MREGSADTVSSIRLVLHNNKLSDLPPEILTKLHKITVVSVPTITTTLTLGSCTVTTSEDVAFEETDDKFTVFVSNVINLGKSINTIICAGLSRLLEVDLMMLFTCITHPVEVVDSLFELYGIAEIPVDDGHDRSWLQAMTQPNVPIVPNATEDTSNLTGQMGTHINVPNYQPGPVWSAFSSFNAPMSSEETDQIGVMGEHFVRRFHPYSASLNGKNDFHPPPPKKVYKLLIRTLDDFGRDNWTSELRHFVPGFAPFHGQAYADFTYFDTQGQLTRTWFGPEKAAAWQGRWPRYHIEVKSTSGEENEPFHMSPNQMATVRLTYSGVM